MKYRSFFSQIGDFSGMSARMLEFCILTASRPGMVQKSTHKDPLTRLPFVAAACLSHFVGDDYGGGYNRPDLADARRECMEAWGRYCVTGLYPDE